MKNRLHFLTPVVFLFFILAASCSKDNVQPATKQTAANSDQQSKKVSGTPGESVPPAAAPSPSTGECPHGH